MSIASFHRIKNLLAALEGARDGEESIRAIAKRVGVSYQTALAYAKELNFPLGRGVGRGKKWPTLAAEFAALRPSLTYQEIGDRYGITRERVRQILEMGEKVDCIGVAAGPHGLVRVMCGCGKAGRTGRRKAFGWKCNACRYNERLKSIGLGPTIAARRVRGETWKAISVDLGLASPSQAQNLVKTWSKRTRTPIPDGVFGRAYGQMKGCAWPIAAKLPEVAA